MQIYWSAVFNFSSLCHYLITQSFVVLSYTVRYMNVLADGFKVASSTLYLGEFHAMQLRDAFRPLGLCHKVNVLDIPLTEDNRPVGGVLALFVKIPHRLIHLLTAHGEVVVVNKVLARVIRWVDVNHLYLPPDNIDIVIPVLRFEIVLQR